MSKVTQQAVKQLLTRKTTKRVFVWDDEIRGFGVRLTPTGTMSFVLNYWFRGKERRYTSGVIPSTPPPWRAKKRWP